MIRVTIHPGLPGSVPIYTCCPCIICTVAPMGALVLTIHDMVPPVIMGSGCGDPEEGEPSHGELLRGPDP